MGLDLPNKTIVVTNRIYDSGVGTRTRLWLHGKIENNGTQTFILLNYKRCLLLYRIYFISPSDQYNTCTSTVVQGGISLK